MEISPAPTAEEAAAIAAALDSAWPRAADTTPTLPPNRWRFAGRWWTKPSTERRERPR